MYMKTKTKLTKGVLSYIKLVDNNLIYSSFLKETQLLKYLKV